MLIHIPATEPPAIQTDYYLRIHGPDQGVINAWLSGLNMHGGKEQAAALRGELPPLDFKGGVEPPPPNKPIKKRKKTGSHWYLAMWQGLRGEDLCIDTESTPSLTCTLTGVTVTFTLDTKTLLKQT